MISVIEPTGRDPRVDPQPGDVIVRELKRDGVVFRTVEGRMRAPFRFVDLGDNYRKLKADEHGERVQFNASNSGGWQASGVHIASWTQWAKDAYVVHIGGE